MTKKRNAIILVILCAGILFSQEKIKIYFDGAEWEKFGKAEGGWGQILKASYLNGFGEGRMEGVLYAISVLEKSNIGKTTLDILIKNILFGGDYTGPGVPYGQIIEGIDAIYSDYANKKIPVYKIAALASRKARGEISEGDIEKQLMELRRQYYSTIDKK